VSLAIALMAFLIASAQPAFCDPPVDIGEDLQARVMTDHTYGVVPLEVTLTALITQGDALIISVEWDFETDGVIDDYGTVVTHVFDDAVDYVVTAEISTTEGTVLATRDIRAYEALMSITFDDGHYSAHANGLPLLQARGLTATAYIVPTWLGQTWYMDWAEVGELQDAGWDIGSHSMTHARLTEVDSAQLHYELGASQAELQAHGLTAYHFAAPHGAHDDTVIAAIQLYYQSNRNLGSRNPGIHDVDAYLLVGNDALNVRGPRYYELKIDSTVADHGWYILNVHKLAIDCWGAPFCIDEDRLEPIIDYAEASRVKIVTVDEALALRSGGLAGVPASPEARLGRVARILRADCALGAARSAACVAYAVASPADLRLGVYDVRGRLVCDLANGVHAPGDYTATWSGRTAGGEAASGVYFCVLRCGPEVLGSRRILVVR
jgi:peptidoglycan/xylan/chitin deacetylase (PgdA/CDA1 family)